MRANAIMAQPTIKEDALLSSLVRSPSAKKPRRIIMRRRGNMRKTKDASLERHQNSISFFLKTRESFVQKQTDLLSLADHHDDSFELRHCVFFYTQIQFNKIR